MSEVLPFTEDQVGRYEAAEGHLSFTCRLRDSERFFPAPQSNKRPPKLGQIGRSQRVTEDDNGDDEAMKSGSEKSPAEV